MAAIALADEVVYLEHGTVADHGPHDELLGRCTGYRDLVTAYERQEAERAAPSKRRRSASVTHPVLDGRPVDGRRASRTIRRRPAAVAGVPRRPGGSPSRWPCLATARQGHRAGRRSSRSIDRGLGGGAAGPAVHPRRGAAGAARRSVLLTALCALPDERAALPGHRSPAWPRCGCKGFRHVHDLSVLHPERPSGAARWSPGSPATSTRSARSCSWAA